MFRPNQQIGPYTLIRELGRGGFKVVWLAERRSAILTTQVALGLPVDPDTDLNTVRAEAQRWLRASGHPNVLPVIDADIYAGQVVIVSEYAPDGSLASWLKRNSGKAPTPQAAVAMGSGILAGLEHLHNRRMIHRDLKPANVLLQGDTPRLTDFGISRVLKSTTVTQNASGTPAYMSPEAFDGHYSPQSDIWAVGVILYQMLAGRLPFPQSELGSLYAAITRHDPEPLPKSVPGPLLNVIARALQKEPAMRFASAAAMRRALLEQAPVSALPAKCRNCRADLVPGDLFCRWCAMPISAATSDPPQQSNEIDHRVAPGVAPRPRMHRGDDLRVRPRIDSTPPPPADKPKPPVKSVPAGQPDSSTQGCIGCVILLAIVLGLSALNNAYKQRAAPGSSPNTSSSAPTPAAEQPSTAPVVTDPSAGQNSGDSTLTAEIQQVWLQPVSSPAGASLELHCRFVVRSSQNVNVRVKAYFYNGDGSSMRAQVVGNYSTPDGQAAVWDFADETTPPDQSWSDFALTIPTSALAPGSGETAKIVIEDGPGNSLSSMQTGPFNN